MMDKISQRHTFELSEDIWKWLDLKEVRATAELLKKHDLYRLPFESDVYLRTSVHAMSRYRDGIGDIGPSEKYQDTGEEIEVRLDSEFVQGSVYTINHYSLLKRPAAREQCRKQAAFYEDRAKVASIKGDVEDALEHNRYAAQERANIFLINQLGVSRFELPMAVAEGFLGGVEGKYQGLLKDILIVLLRSKGTAKSETIVRAPSQYTVNADCDIEVITRISLPRCGDSVALGGSHASPRMHLRRGHEHRFRYGPGRTQVRSKFVDAVWINEDAKFKAVRKEYKLDTSTDVEPVE